MGGICEYGIIVAVSHHAAFVTATLLAKSIWTKQKVNTKYKLVGNLSWDRALHVISLFA